jgi:hypothetical protein
MIDIIKYLGTTATWYLKDTISHFFHNNSKQKVIAKELNIFKTLLRAIEK